MEKFLQTPAREQELVTQEGTTACTREREAAAEAAHVGAHRALGLIVVSGTGSTGWATSIHRERRIPPALPAVRDGFLSWFVREA